MDDKAVQWLMASGIALDASLDEFDRMRYYVFDLLQKEDKVTEGMVRQYLLTRLSEEHDLEPIFSDVTALLRTVGREVKSHVWQFEPKRYLITNSYVCCSGHHVQMRFVIGLSIIIQSMEESLYVLIQKDLLC